MAAILELETDEIRLSVCIPATLKRKLDNFTTRFAMKHGLTALTVTQMAAAILERALETGSVELEATPPLVSEAEKEALPHGRPRATSKAHVEHSPVNARPKPPKPEKPVTYQSELRALVRRYPPRKFTAEEHLRYVDEVNELKAKWGIV